MPPTFKAAEGSLSPNALSSALRKARWRLLPLLAIGYLVAYMDRSNLSFAADSMNRQLHFSPEVYGLGSGLFFISYALCEVPSNALLLRFGAKRWLARIMLTWGLLAMAMVFVRSTPTFYGARLLLGCAEAGYFPGVLYYISQWFPASQRARAISWFYISLPLSTVLMGLVAGSLLHMDGWLGLRGWQWLFLIEGLPAVLMSFLFWFGLPNSPLTARWLNAAEREALSTELYGDAPAQSQQTDLWLVLGEPRVWVMGAFNFCMLGMSYAMNFFLPLMLGGLMHWSAQRIGFAIAASGAVAVASMLLNAVHSDRRKERRWHIALPMLGIALVELLAARPGGGPVAAFAMLSLLALYAAMQGPVMAIASQLFPGKNAALAIAIFNMCGICGGFVGPYWMGWMHKLTGGYAFGVGALCLPSLLAVACILWLTKDPVGPTKAVLEIEEFG